MSKVYEMSHRDKLALLFRETLKIQEVTIGLPVSNRLDYAVSVFLSQSLKAYSIWSICNPVPRNEILDNNGVIDDFSSGFVLLRSMYEAILVSRFTLLDTEFSGCRNIVVQVAILHGAREQNVLLKSLKSTSPKAESIETYCSTLRGEILQENEYDKLPKYAKSYIAKQNIPNHNWYPKRKFTMKELASRAGFMETKHSQFYKYFSNYAHSDPFALHQIGAVRDPIQAKRMIKMIYWLTENFLTTSLDNHRKVCNSENVELQISEEVLELIYMWTKFNKLEFEEPTRDA